MTVDTPAAANQRVMPAVPPIIATPSVPANVPASVPSPPRRAGYASSVLVARSLRKCSPTSGRTLVASASRLPESYNQGDQIDCSQYAAASHSSGRSLNHQERGAAQECKRYENGRAQ